MTRTSLEALERELGVDAVTVEARLNGDDVALSEPLVAAVEQYEAVVGTRDPYLWHWLSAIFPLFRLSCVPTASHDRVLEQKVLLTMFITLLDDVAERDGDRATFEEARKVPFPAEQVDTDRDDVDGELVEFAQWLWDRLEEGLRAAPRYEEFVHVLRFDLRQALNAIDYSLLVNECLDVATLGGCEQYDVHNMVVFSYVDIDLLHSPDFDRRDNGELREAVWDAQMMARIGNWVTTWERELGEGDYSSGIVVYALRNGIVDIDELRGDEPTVEELADRIRNHGVEEYFLTEWETRYGGLKAGRLDAHSVDLDAFVEGMRRVMAYHLASRGKK
ncbi:hypothetical protein SAMN04487949_2715 [Halogranum gelatinilyticum]|uniref:Uncharacterized protein n=1 Tax=Halogranum gelatinilyticum TaxID=660521 RepID=A0A1G9WE68_9EURY|nr:hypothetical protein [Halogranum gelatinilyticum]SDM82541.1 hypothetical protein SAMN04487949_2715 [Halogranum gelatinilyticum]